MGASSSKKKKDKKGEGLGFLGDLADAAEGATNSLTKAIEDTSTAVASTIESTTKNVTDSIDSAAKNLSGQAEGAISEANQSVEDAKGGVSSTVTQLKSGIEQTTQKAVDDATKVVSESSDSIKKQAKATESQAQKTAAGITAGLNDKADSISKSAEKTVEEARKNIQSINTSIQEKSEKAKETVDSKINEIKSQAEASKDQLKGQMETTASKVNTTTENIKNNLNDFSQKSVAAAKNLESQANEAKKTAENKSNELKGATEAKFAEWKGNLDAETSELKDAAQKKTTELIGTVDGKTAELKGIAKGKAAELDAKSTELKETVDAKATALNTTAQAKAVELKDAAHAKANEINATANTKIAELNSNVEQLKQEADNRGQELQQSISQTRDKIDKGRSELESEVKGNVGVVEGLKSAVSDAVEGAVHVASDAAHKTVEGVGQSLTKATTNVSKTLTGAVNQVSSSVSSAAGSAVPNLLGKVGQVGASLSQGVTSFNRMADTALDKAADAVGLTPSVAVCKVDELKDGEMRVFKVSDDGNILLVRENGQFSALGTKCSHYGAPLVKGVLSNGTVRCPWHGACFSTKTGDIEDSPGLDGIPCYQVTVEDGQVKVVVPPDLKQNVRTRTLSRRDKEDQRNFVIIGGGGAAECCAETLRQHGYTGRVIVLTKEDHLPYDRPKLSKALSSTGQELALRSQDYFKSGDIEVLLNHEVTSVDVTEKTVTCSNSAVFSYDKLMIATGGKPSTTDAPGNDLGNIFYLRTPGDANRIAEAAKDKNAVVIGTSFIGMEVASYLNGKAKTVSIVGRSKTPFENVLGEKVGEQIKKLCSEKGIQVYTETGVSEFVASDGKLSAVKLKNGEELPADVCVIGIGVKPSTEFLKDSGVPLNERGFIPVDQNMRTSIEDIFGAGDIVEFPLPLFKKERVNIGHWQMAQTQGRQAAYSMLGIEKFITTVPFFWCAFFGKTVRYAGYAEGVDDYIIDGDVQDLKCVVYACSGNKVVAVASLGAEPVASNFASYIRNGKSISKTEIERDPKGWITSCDRV